MIKPISMPSLASEACFMSGRGPGAALQPGAAGGSKSTKKGSNEGIEPKQQRDRTQPITSLKHLPALIVLQVSESVSQRSHQIELVFRLLLKTTVVVAS